MSEAIIHYLTCRDDRLITVLVDEEGQLVFRYPDGSLYDIEVDLAEAGLGFGASRCVKFLNQFEDAPFTIIIDSGLVTPLTTVQFATQWLLSMPIFDEPDPAFAQEQEQARAFVVEHIVNVTQKANRKDHDPLLDTRVSSQSMTLKNYGTPFWIHGSVGVIRYLYEIHEASLRGSGERRSLIFPVMNFDLNLRALDRDRYSREFAAEAKGHRMFQMAQALGHAIRPGGKP